MRHSRSAHLLLACGSAQRAAPAGAQEVIDLSEEHQAQLWREVAAASRALRKCMRPDKLNIGAIGNQARPHALSRVGLAPGAASPLLPLGAVTCWHTSSQRPEQRSCSPKRACRPARWLSDNCLG